MTAFKATYADWKLIKTRGCVQVVFELPLESADEAYQVLGGMPISAREVWCGIARLDLAGGSTGERYPDASGQEVAGSTPARPATPSDKERRSFDEMPVPQQAGMLCQERAFRLFLAEKFEVALPDPEEAAEIVRDYCGVRSRSEITKKNTFWSEIMLAYRLWQRAAEVVPA